MGHNYNNISLRALKIDKIIHCAWLNRKICKAMQSAVMLNQNANKILNLLFLELVLKFDS